MQEGRQTVCAEQAERRRRLKYTAVFLIIALTLIGTVILLSRCAVKEGIPRSPDAPGRGLEIPRIDNPKFLVFCEEGRYVLLYDTLYRQAAWVAHVLTRRDVENDQADRQDRFIVCPSVQANGWPYARESDYTGTGYDRGHLIPSADRVQTQDENDATFRMSNIVPQTPGLNRGIWNNLEQELRRMAVRMDTLWIVTGGVLRPGLPCLDTSGVGIPEYYFKVVLTRADQGYQSLAFIIPNAPQIEGTFWDYAVPTDEAEKISNHDFFPALSDALEEQIEAQCLPQKWQ